MGKRKKSSRGPVKKQKQTLDTVFQCLFCNHEKAVVVQLDKKNSIGFLKCKVCGQTYQTAINYLSAAVDVYSDWIDACEAVADTKEEDLVKVSRMPPGQDEEGGGSATTQQAPSRSTQKQEPSRRPPKSEDFDDLDGFLENDEEENLDEGYGARDKEHGGNESGNKHLLSLDDEDDDEE